jgi:SAM-dependent methyltransferase
VPRGVRTCLERAGVLEETDGLLRSKVRVSSLGGLLFLHSSFPTASENAVFFGPDTYRFARFIEAELRGSGPVQRLVDVGAGSGAGGLYAATLLPGTRIVLLDVNAQALQLAAANARAAGIDAELVHGSTLDAVAGEIELAIANPPFVMDEDGRAYRDGGGMHGAQLSLDWTLRAAHRVLPGGRVLLYTGSAVVDGRDALKAGLQERLSDADYDLRYEELDPDIFGEELDRPAYREVERIAAVGAAILKKLA